MSNIPYAYRYPVLTRCRSKGHIVIQTHSYFSLTLRMWLHQSKHAIDYWFLNQQWFKYTSNSESPLIVDTKQSHAEEDKCISNETLALCHLGWWWNYFYRRHSFKYCPYCACWLMLKNGLQFMWIQSSKINGPEKGVAYCMKTCGTFLLLESFSCLVIPNNQVLPVSFNQCLIEKSFY